jgi:hypothetical protein
VIHCVVNPITMRAREARRLAAPNHMQNGLTRHLHVHLKLPHLLFFSFILYLFFSFIFFCMGFLLVLSLLYFIFLLVLLFSIFFIHVLFHYFIFFLRNKF